MNYKRKKELLKHITLGTSEVLYYPYKGGKEPLPLRPLSSFELDQCFYKSFDNATDPKLVGFLIKYRLEIIRGTQEINFDEIPNEKYINLLKLIYNTNYWVVYESMKDFQDEDFRKPDYDKEEKYPKGYYIVKQMNEVHEIAELIMDTSSQPDSVIKEILSDKFGRDVAYAVYYLNVPLAELKKLTKLQKKYLVLSNGNLDTYAEIDRKNNSYSLSDEEMTMKEFLEKFK